MSTGIAVRNNRSAEWEALVLLTVASLGFADDRRCIDRKFAAKATRRMLTLVTEQWKDTTKGRASKTVRCQSARSVCWVGINQKSKYTRVYEDGSVVQQIESASDYAQLIGACGIAIMSEGQPYCKLTRPRRTHCQSVVQSSAHEDKWSRQI